MNHTKRFRRISLLLAAIALLCVLPLSALAAGNGRVNVDDSKASDGIVLINHVGKSPKRLKVRITFGSNVYNYDLNSSGKVEVFPLQLGDGSYKIGVYQQVSGNTYSLLHSETVDAKISDDKAPFLQPNQRVNFSDSTKVVKVAKKLVKGLKTDVEMIDAIYAYVIDNYSYDYDKAKDAIAGRLVGYLPDLDELYESKTGICYDYASMLAAMLRAVGIPAKLVMGYVAPDDVYHAWNEVYIEGEGWVVKQVHFAGEEWKLMDPTFASAGKNSTKINRFIGNGSNYSTKYFY
ncbi:MAG: transglutaminase-like domain-containing protein [Christensenellales bacterium]